MKKKVAAVFITLMIVVVCVLLSFVEKKVSIAEVSDDSELIPIGEITENTSVKQQFYVDVDKINGYTVKFANYGNITNGTLKLTLSDPESKKILNEFMLDISEVKDNEIYRVKFDNIQLNTKLLQLDIEGINTKKNQTVTVYACKTDSAPNLEMNHASVEGSVLYLDYFSPIFSVQRCIYLTVSILLLFYYMLFIFKIMFSKK